MFVWCLKQLKDSILKFLISGSFISQKAFLNYYTVILVSFPSGRCADEVDNWANYVGYKDDVYFLVKIVFFLDVYLQPEAVTRGVL